MILPAAGLGKVNRVYKIVDSPVGRLTLIASEEGLCGMLFASETPPVKYDLGKMKLAGQHPLLRAAEQQLEQYFQGKRKRFELPLVMEGTAFQKQAWKVLQGIPYGEVISYEEQATRLGDMHKARAVGAANARNPIAIIVPCHRVIGKKGSLTGFGGGLEVKRFLLEMECEKKVGPVKGRSLR